MAQVYCWWIIVRHTNIMPSCPGVLPYQDSAPRLLQHRGSSHRDPAARGGRPAPGAYSRMLDSSTGFAGWRQSVRDESGSG